MYSKGEVPWNRGKKLSDKMRKSISAGKTGVSLQQKHKDRIGESQRIRWQVIKGKQCSQCSKRNQYVYGASMPSITSYILRLCTDCFLSQYFGLSQEERKGVRIVE